MRTHAEIAANARKPYADAITKLQTSHDALTSENARLREVLELIILRINGVYDDPRLMGYGPLSGTASDALTIARAALSGGEK